jgi:hypothetical protein
MKALLVLGLAIAASVLVVLVSIGVGQGDATSRGVITRSLHARATTYVQIDNGKRGRSAGDISTFTHALTEHGRRVGRDEGYCVRILSGTSECTMTTVLSDGQITIAGPFNYVGVNHLAVTGGTGAYAHVRGSVTVHRAGFFQLDLTYDLSPG